MSEELIEWLRAHGKYDYGARRCLDAADTIDRLTRELAGARKESQQWKETLDRAFDDVAALRDDRDIARQALAAAREAAIEECAKIADKEACDPSEGDYNKACRNLARVFRALVASPDGSQPQVLPHPPK